MGLIDFEAIATTPQRFFGYSDITALHLQLTQQCNFVSFPTSMPGTALYNWFAHYTLAYPKKALL